MAIRPILQFPHQSLSTPCQTILIHDNPLLKRLIADLTDTLYHSPGVGLAAPQIGVMKRVSVIDISRKKWGGNLKNITLLINPKLLSGMGIQIPREGCLSIPDLLANVRRYKRVRISTDTLMGGRRILDAEGFEALALQHEIDHLDGKLFLDRILNIRTDVFRRKHY